MQKYFAILSLVLPSNISLLSEKYLRLNGSRKFEMFCTFDANPEARIVWKFNKRNIASKNVNVTEIVLSSNVYNTRKRSFLRIEVVDRHMQGEYQCIATNLLGNATQQTQLIVHCKYAYNIFITLSISYNIVQRTSKGVQHSNIN